jgi:hypothetical protein
MITEATQSSGVYLPKVTLRVAVVPLDALALAPHLAIRVVATTNSSLHIRNTNSG